jgi:cyclohexyl-isocyanide hydratase
MEQDLTHFAMLLVPGMTQLDLTAPYEVFVRCPRAKVHLAWKTLDPVVTEHGLTILPTITLDALPAADVLFIPGGRGTNALLNDPEVLAWVRQLAQGAAHVTSVCTGALVLGAAGLLKGKRATTHWTAMDFLPLLGALPVNQRVVSDGKLLTGGGVTAGIDFALSLAAEMHGIDVAQAIQLAIEYNPAPPFDSGHPDCAPPAVAAALGARIEPRQAERLEQVMQAARRLGLAGTRAPEAAPEQTHARRAG